MGARSVLLDMYAMTMARRRFLLVAAGAATAGLTGCGSRASSMSPPVDVFTPAQPISIAPSGSAQDAGSAARAALTGFGVDFLRAAMDVKPTPATGISPYSLFTVLAMVRAGAAGRTAEQIDGALKATGSQAQGAVVTAVDAGMAAALDAAAAAHSDPMVLQAANQTWADHRLQVHQSYLDALARDFGSTAQLADFAGDPEGMRQAINTWVADRTNDLIPELFPQGTIDSGTRMVLVNALYLKAQWLNAFAPRQDGPFTTADGRQLTVPLMTTEQPVPGFRGAGWAAAILPYTGSGLGMTVVMPDAGIDDALDDLPAIVETIAADREGTPTAVTLPVFSLRSNLDARGIAQRLGITHLFDAAELSGISDEPLNASAFVHQCVVKVDEKGTEAAAATGIAMIESASTSSEHLVVDRPFLFWIADSTTGAPLFLGVVNEPSDTA
ncbi:serpin family protein [Nakamurella flava]|uniref:Serpin family protein n=1 Tax=Nakamurella flava TaxID=2576308 RepID=A0A4U6Q934_9ACTN|nr:serpin family protein [Nakamurella flava]TKV56382.1 serpin family protein [Nakamurella flava]